MMSLRYLSGLGLYNVLIESLEYELGAKSLKGVGIYQAASVLMKKCCGVAFLEV